MEGFNYLIEQVDINGRWHLIETSSHVFYKFRPKIKDFRTQNWNKVIEQYFSSDIVKIRSINYRSWNKKDMEDIDFFKLNSYHFSPLSKYYLDTFLICLYNSFEYENLDRFLERLNQNDQKKLKGSIDYLSSLKPMLKLYIENDKKILLSDVVSNHECLKIIDAEFCENNLENFRIIIYKS